MILRFVFNNLKSKPLRNILVTVSVVISIMLVLLVFNTGKQLYGSFSKGTSRFDIVIGKPGSETQVVLNALFYYENPVGNIPYSVMQTVEQEYGEQGSKAQAIQRLVPLALGDNIDGYKIVGTTLDYFFDREVKQGKLFGEHEHGNPEIVLGYNTARGLGLALGDKVCGAHGDGGHEHADFMYTVVGVLAKTGTADDHAAFTAIESVWEVHTHEEDTDEQEEHTGDLTAILVKTSSFSGSLLMMSDEDYKQQQLFNVISANAVLRNVMDLFGSAQSAVSVVLAMVVFVTFNMLFLAMFTAASERQKEIAILRALGSNKNRILATIILEAVFIALVGVVAGWLLSRIGLAVAGLFVQGMFGVQLTPFSFYAQELLVMLAAVVLAVLAALIPAITVYRSEPSKYLSN